MPTLQLYEDKVYLWNYIPSLPLSITFASIFFVITAAHVWRMVRAKLWFCIPFIIGGIFEVIGYLSRTAAYNETGSLVPYLLQSIFLLLAPIFFAATLYMFYERIVHALHAEHLSLISVRWTTRLFVFSDFMFLSIQSDGGGLLAKPSKVQLGTDIIVAGLVLQILGFVGFIVCCVVFHHRFAINQRLPQDAEETGTERIPPASLPWRAFFYMLYGTSAAILARNLYRIVEFVMGTDGFLQAHEWPVYAFDGGLMLAVMLVFFMWHPSTVSSGGVSFVSAEGVDRRESMIELTSNETSSQAEHEEDRLESGPSFQKPGIQAEGLDAADQGLESGEEYKKKT